MLYVQINFSILSKATYPTDSISIKYFNWKLIDGQLHSFLSSTLSPPIMSYFRHIKSSTFWTVIEKLLTSISLSEIYHLHNLLSTITQKSNQTIQAYLDEFQSLDDQLAQDDTLAPATNLIFHTACGLHVEYDIIKPHIYSLPVTTAFVHFESIHIEMENKSPTASDAQPAIFDSSEIFTTNHSGHHGGRWEHGGCNGPGPATGTDGS